MVRGHVILQHFRVCAGGGFPARLFARSLKIVREVLGVAVTDLPACGKACLCGRLPVGRGKYVSTRNAHQQQGGGEGL